MNFFTQTAIKYPLCLCTFLLITLSNAQHKVANTDLEAEIISNLIITDGELLIDLTDPSESKNLNQSSDVLLFNDNNFLPLKHNDRENSAIDSTISLNLSSGIKPTLTTKVSLKTMQRVWRVLENGTNITKVNLRLQEQATGAAELLGNYYMFISNTGVFDYSTNYKIMSSDENGNLETEYHFDSTTYITFGFSPHLRFERSIYFDGTDDYIDMDNNLDLNPSGFTVSAWVKRDAANFGKVSIVSKRDAAFIQGYDLRLLNNNRIEIIWKNDSDT